MKENKKLSSPEAIIFDKDGTLISLYAFWEPVSRAAIDKLLSLYSLDTSLTEGALAEGGFSEGKADIRGVLSFGTFDEIAELVAKTLEREGREYDMKKLSRETAEAFEEFLYLGKLAPTCEGLGDALSALRSRGIKLAVVTTDRMPSTMLALRELGIDEYFDDVITAELMTPKPDPAGIKYISEKYGIDKSRMIMVGDTFNDTKFAKNGGIFSVAVSDSEGNRELLRAEADAVIAKISDIFEVIG